jgi:hypothetical protein
MSPFVVWRSHVPSIQDSHPEKKKSRENELTKEAASILPRVNISTPIKVHSSFPKQIIR